MLLFFFFFLHTAGRSCFGDDPERLMVWSPVMSLIRPPPASDTSSQVISANEGPRRQDTAAFITRLFSFRLITDAMKDERGQP